MLCSSLETRCDLGEVSVAWECGADDKRQTSLQGLLLPGWGRCVLSRVPRERRGALLCILETSPEGPAHAVMVGSDQRHCRAYEMHATHSSE